MLTDRRVLLWELGYSQKLVVVPSKKELGLAFKGNQKMVVQALEVSPPFSRPPQSYLFLDRRLVP